MSFSGIDNARMALKLSSTRFELFYIFFADYIDMSQFYMSLTLHLYATYVTTLHTLYNFFTSFYLRA